MRRRLFTLLSALSLLLCVACAAMGARSKTRFDRVVVRLGWRVISLESLDDWYIRVLDDLPPEAAFSKRLEFSSFYARMWPETGISEVDALREGRRRWLTVEYTDSIWSGPRWKR
jgi:hypothetical protein